MSNEEKIKLLRNAMDHGISQAKKRLSEIPHDIHHRDERNYCEIAISRMEEAIRKTNPW